MSRPSKVIFPPVGSSSRVSSRPVVLLPQPDSPTIENVSPRLTAKFTPSTACTAPTWRRSSPPRIGKCLTRSLDDDQVRVLLRASGRRLMRRRGHSFGAISCSQICSRSVGDRWQATVWPGSTGASSGRTSSLRPSFRAAYAQRGWNGQPGGTLIRLGGVPVIGSSRSLLIPVEARHRAEQAPGVGVRGPVEELLGAAVLHRAAGVHHQHVVGELGDHAEVVGDHHDGGVELASAGRGSGRGSAPGRSRRARWSARRRSAGRGRTTAPSRSWPAAASRRRTGAGRRRRAGSARGCRPGRACRWRACAPPSCSPDCGSGTPR